MHQQQDHPDQTLVGISFGDSFRASEFLTASQGLAAKGSLLLLDAVVVTKDAEGKTVVVETTDPQPMRSAMSGAVWAGLFGLLLGGPVGWVAGAAVGAGAGAVAAKVVDIGIPDEWVEWFRQAVQPGTTTVVLLVADLNREALITETRRFPGAQLIYANVDPDTLGRLRHALGAPDGPSAPLAPPSNPTDAAATSGGAPGGTADGSVIP